ncbi:formylglycine-generating enzyme family protein [Sorangium sp. So ce1099]|uniref:formylglycine-generating enzyme family protein n=1 Tax=Sorangium sp. So ce1099 TaxID=3133331 RepID=UPI003F6407D7
MPGGSFVRQEHDMDHPATVSDFLLDRFEVTVGRFRNFVNAYPGNIPGEGDGSNPRINGRSGWDPGWNDSMPASEEALIAEMNCDDTLHTWTDDVGDHEHLPMDCLSWYVAFAFCAWDGGRLPTEAEWHYAASGGGEQRKYPWSNPATSTIIDDSYAVYDCTGDGSAPGECAFSDIQPVGSRSPTGDGKWGQADLAGSMYEWTLDFYDNYSYLNPCDDCANLDNGPGQTRVLRGGSYWHDASIQYSATRYAHRPSIHYGWIGVRCARTP